MPTADRPRLSVVVCTYERYGVLPGAVASLMAQELNSADIEIIVVDNSRDQARASEFAKRYENTLVRYLLEPKPGLSNARNVGTAAARADRVAFIDDDAVAAPDWARRILEAFDIYGARAGVVGGRILPRWLSEGPSWLSEDLTRFLTIIDWGGQLRELSRDQWVAGCNIAYHKPSLVAAGGFSTSLGRTGSTLALLSSEETEVTSRIEGMGLVVVYAPGAVVEHLIDPARLKPEWFRRRMAWQAVSDCIKEPDRVLAYAPAATARLYRHLETANGRVPPGLSCGPLNPAEFGREVDLVYDLVVSVLCGGPEIKAANHQAIMTPSFSERAVAHGKDLARRMPALAPALRKLYRLVRSTSINGRRSQRTAAK